LLLTVLKAVLLLVLMGVASCSVSAGLCSPGRLGDEPEGFSSSLIAIAYEDMTTPIGGVFRPADEERCFSQVSVNSAGDVVFKGKVFRDGKYLTGIFLYSASSKRLVKVVAVGDPSPAGTEIEWVNQPRLTEDGDVLYSMGYSTRPSEAEPEGRRVNALQIFSNGSTTTVVTSEYVVFTRSSMAGYLLNWQSTDIDDAGDIVIDGVVGFYNTSRGRAPPDRADFYERGVFLRAALFDDYFRVVLEGSPAPSGGKIGWPVGEESVRVSTQSSGGYGFVVARSCAVIDHPEGGVRGGIFLYDGSRIVPVVLWREQLTWVNGPPGESSMDVQSTTLLDVNRHGQVALSPRTTSTGVTSSSTPRGRSTGLRGTETSPPPERAPSS